MDDTIPGCNGCLLNPLRLIDTLPSDNLRAHKCDTLPSGGVKFATGQKDISVPVNVRV